MAILPGRRLGPYEILSAIGAGGMGEVYKARDTRLDRNDSVEASIASAVHFTHPARTNSGKDFVWP